MFTAEQIVAPYILAWTGIAGYALFARAWHPKSVAALSFAASIAMIFCSCAYLLTGITRSDALSPAAASAAASVSPGDVPSVTYANDNPAPFIQGLFILFLAGGTVDTGYPLWDNFVWTPFFVPVIYLIAYAIFPQPEGRYTQARRESSPPFYYPLSTLRYS